MPTPKVSPRRRAPPKKWRPTLTPRLPRLPAWPPKLGA
nr:MAG TPA: hypothetical protein [Caudoviricetes sp.]